MALVGFWLVRLYDFINRWWTIHEILYTGQFITYECVSVSVCCPFVCVKIRYYELSLNQNKNISIFHINIHSVCLRFIWVPYVLIQYALVP